MEFRKKVFPKNHFTFRDYEWMWEHYINQQLTTRELARRAGCCQETAWRWLRNLGIPTRDAKTARKLMKHGHRWNGGRKITNMGYVLVRHPRHRLADVDGYVPEHRLVAEEAFHCTLAPKEVVHHVNKNKQDNRPENLIVFANNTKHLKYGHGKGL